MRAYPVITVPAVILSAEPRVSPEYHKVCPPKEKEKACSGMTRLIFCSKMLRRIKRDRSREYRWEARYLYLAMTEKQVVNIEGCREKQDGSDVHNRWEVEEGGRWATCKKWHNLDTISFA